MLNKHRSASAGIAKRNQFDEPELSLTRFAMGWVCPENQKTPRSHILGVCAAIVANTGKARLKLGRGEREKRVGGGIRRFSILMDGNRSEIRAKIDRRTSNGECMEEWGVGRGSTEHPSKTHQTSSIENRQSRTDSPQTLI